MSSREFDHNSDKLKRELEAAIKMQVRLKVNEIYMQVGCDPMFVAASAMGVDIQTLVTEQIKETLKKDFEEGI